MLAIPSDMHGSFSVSFSAPYSALSVSLTLVGNKNTVVSRLCEVDDTATVELTSYMDSEGIFYMSRNFSIDMERVKKFLDPCWREPNVKNAFIFNILLGGAIILIFIVLLKDTGFKQEAINRYFDQYILWRMDVDENSFFDKYILFGKAADKETRENAREIIFLDFDDDAIKTINRTDLTPRNKTADLIRAAYNGGASIIFVDIDFSEPDLNPARLIAGDEVALTGAERDQILYDLLKTIRDDPNSDTKILIPSMTYSDHTAQPNIFAELIDGKKIFEVTPMLSEYKSNTRFWIPYLKAKHADTGEPYILWSPQIMTLILKYGRLDELNILNLLSDTDENMSTHFFKVDRNGVRENFPIYEEMYTDEGIVRDTQAEQYNRIQYVIFPAGVKASKPINGNLGDDQRWSWRINGIDESRFNCRDKIVIVGRDDNKCNDFHSTPVGRMPGMYIHANAIATALSSSRPHLCTVISHMAIEFFLVVITAYIFLNFEGWVSFFSVLGVFVCADVFLPYFWYCFTNECIFTNMAFMNLGFYTGVKAVEKKVIKTASWQIVSGLSKFISMLVRK